jgi:pentatricopeptide repeat protein
MAAVEAPVATLIKWIDTAIGMISLSYRSCLICCLACLYLLSSRSTDAKTGADRIKKVQCTPNEGYDVKKTRGARQKTSLLPALSVACIVVALFYGDILLLGTLDDANASWLPEAWQVWKIMSSDYPFALEFCWAILALLAYISVQFSRRKFFDKSTARKGVKGITKKPNDTSRREEMRNTPSKRVANNASIAKAAEFQNQLIRSKKNVEIAAAAKEGDIKEATRLLLKFESEGENGCRPDIVSYNLVIRACAKHGDLKSVLKWIEHVESKGIEANSCSYNMILDACAKAHTWVAAEACERWLEQMLDKGLNANVVSYGSVVHAWARRGEEARAEKWMKRMIDDGIKPDEVAYNSMIHACSVSGNPAGAERWMRDMQDRGIEASVTTFATVIDACSKGGDLPSAERCFEAMLEAKIQPNVVTFSAMIDACAKKADPDRAEYWLNRMLKYNIKPNAHSFSAIINAFSKARDPERAEQWLGHAETVGIQDAVIYSSVLSACGKATDAERARKIFQRMVDNGIKPQIMAYSALARPFSYGGDWVEVERIANDMSANGVKANEYFLYAQLISYATAKPRQDERAEQCFRQALRSGMEANDHTVTALCRAVGRSRCTELMQELCNGRDVPYNPCQQKMQVKSVQNLIERRKEPSNVGGSKNVGSSKMPPWRK